MSILRQVPALMNCRGFYLSEPAVGRETVPLPMNAPIPSNMVWVLVEQNDFLLPAHQQVYIVGAGGIYSFLLDTHLTPAEMLWPVAVALSGTGSRTQWWFEQPPWMPSPRFRSRSLHNFIPLGLQFVGVGAILHWNFAVQTAWWLPGWLPEDMRRPMSRIALEWVDAPLPPELSELQRAHMPLALLRRSRSRSPRIRLEGGGGVSPHRTSGLAAACLR